MNTEQKYEIELRKAFDRSDFGNFQEFAMTFGDSIRAQLEKEPIFKIGDKVVVESVPRYGDFKIGDVLIIIAISKDGNFRFEPFSMWFDSDNFKKEDETIDIDFEIVEE